MNDPSTLGRGITVGVEMHTLLINLGLSFTTGGACFLPKSLSEALKLFEMETLLSIRARVVPQNLRYVRSAVSNIHSLFALCAAFKCKLIIQH